MSINGKLVKRIAILMTIVLIVSSAAMIFFKINVDAKYTESNCVTFGSYASSHSIPDGTLFVGVYLIDLNAFNETLYRMATETASEADRNTMYYKSELGNGLWYDVTDASGVEEIMLGGSLADMDEVNSELVRYYINPQGVIYDIWANRSDINLFVSDDFYSWSKMSEFENLVKIRDEYLGTNRKSKNKKYYYDKVSQYLSCTGNSPFDPYQIRAARMQCQSKYDTPMNNFAAGYKRLLSTGNPEDAELSQIMFELMDSLYAQKQVEYYGAIVEYSSSDSINTMFIDPVQYLCETDDDDDNDDDGDEDEDYTAYSPDSSVSDIWLQAIADINTTIQDANARIITAPGDSAAELDKMKYNYFTWMINNHSAAASMSNEFKTYLRMYQAITHINGGVVGNANLENAEIDKALPLTTAKYRSGISSDVSSDYVSAVAMGATDNDKRNILENQFAGVEAYRNELQFLIYERKFRSSPAYNKNFIQDRLRLTYALYNDVIGSDFSSYANLSIAEHIEWLEADLEQVDELSSDKSKLDELQDSLDALREEYMEALDENELDEAEEIEEQIEKLSEEIEKLIDEMYNSGDMLQQLEAENTDSVLGLIADLQAQVIDNIAEGATSSNALNSLVEIGATSAINELSEKLGDNECFKSALRIAENLKTINSLGADSSETLVDAINRKKAGADVTDEGAGGTDEENGGKGDTAGTDLSEEDVLEALEEAMGKPVDEMSDEEKAEAAAAIADLVDDGNDDVKDLLDDLTGEIVGKDGVNAFVNPATDMDGNYVSLKAVEKVTDFRYAYDKSKRIATMEKLTVGKSFKFTSGSEKVIEDGTQEREMLGVAKLVGKTIVYIPRDEAKNFFDVEVKKLGKVNGRNYSIVFNSKDATAVAKIKDALK